MREIGVLVFIVLAAFFGVFDAKIAPDFIHPCNNTEQSCLIQATKDAIPDFAKGIPNLGVPSLDPFIIDELPIQLPGVKVTFLDGKVTGLRKCEVLNVEAYLERNIFVLEVKCNITIKGKYTAVGRLLLFPINGEGDSKIKITNSVIKMNIKTKYFKDDQGRDHFGIKSYRYTFDYGEKIHYVITNLFKGNPELSNTVLAFLNENWRTVTEEFGKPVVDYAMNVTIDTARKFFNAVPYDELVYVPIPKYYSELEKRHFVLEFHCNLTIRGQYGAVGQILLFPINGEGDAKVKLTNLRMKVDINTKYIKDKNEVNHFALKNYKYTFDYGDRVSFDLKNLFKESKELSNTVLAFLNENWRTVAEEFGKPLVDYAVDLAIRTIEKFFLAVPYEELVNVPIPKF